MYEKAVTLQSNDAQLLDLRKFPDPILRQKCAPVAEVTDDIRRLLCDMALSMLHYNGVGLAAPQIGQTVRLFVVDIWWPDIGQVSEKTLAFVNPVVTPLGNGRKRGKEGCLSFPGINEFIERADRIHVKALNEKGDPFEMEAEGFLARAIQHENDHLDGITFVDRLGPLARRMIKKTLG